MSSQVRLIFYKYLSAVKSKHGNIELLLEMKKMVKHRFQRIAKGELTQTSSASLLDAIVLCFCGDIDLHSADMSGVFTRVFLL